LIYRARGFASNNLEIASYNTGPELVSLRYYGAGTANPRL
jgi:hypothetical protein